MKRNIPRILFAKDGEIYCFGEQACIAVGGAYSVDKYYRLARGWRGSRMNNLLRTSRFMWNSSLQSTEIRLTLYFSHTCPLKYEPTEVFLSGIDQEFRG